MKKKNYLIILLLVGGNLFAQNPGGISGSVLWLKANTGASPAAWNDNSASVNNFTQATGANQPGLATNIFNFYPALQFNGSAYQTQAFPVGFPTGDADRTVLVVANTTDNTSFKWIFVYGAPGTPNGTFQMGNNNGALVNAYYASPDDMSLSNYWSATGNGNGALASFILNSGNTTEYQFDRGLQVNSQVRTQTLLAGLSLAQIGGLLGATENWVGNIAEVIMFPSVLSDAARNQVESYLALKYGFTLGNTTSPLNYAASDASVFWTGNATYQTDIFGIGRDDGSSLSQTTSNSMNSGNGDGTGQSGKGNLILTTGTALTDKQFLLIGNDAGALSEHLIASGEASVNAVGSLRVPRNWQVQNTGALGTVDLSFDTTGLTYSGGALLINYQLMIDEDGDGNYFTGTQTFAVASSVTGNKLNFTGLTLNNNAVFTIITKASTLLPALWQGFTVQVQKDKVVLNWKTSNEINVDRYDAEHSLNGTSFSVVGKVTAKNGTTGTNNYSLSLEKVPAGTHYYRLRRVDKDAQFQYSETKTVQLSGNQPGIVINANPVTGSQLGININAVQNSTTVIRIVSLEGKTLLQQNTSLSAGSNTFRINISAVPAGTYLVQVSAGNEILHSKFIRR